VRYIPHSEADVAKMLESIGVKDVDDLFEQIPAELRFTGDLDLPEALSEPELMAHLAELAGPRPAEGRVPFLGAGIYWHHVPPAVDQLLQRAEFYTAYTPYQPEVSQGTLQAIFEFQTMICRIFGMGVANASMYDGATAMTEAGLMARRVRRRERLLVSAGIHPEYRDVLTTYLNALDGDAPKVELIPIDEATGATDLAALEGLLGDDAAAVIVGYPSFYGVVERLDEIAAEASAAGALTVSVTMDPYALGVLTPPGELGVDIAVGEGQSIATAMSYGGPGVGLFACRDDKKLLRQMPGRLAGQTVDKHGKTGYVLTLSTREQHIRREKATSNICTNHGLCALAATVNLSLLGKTGFARASRSCLARAEYLKSKIAAIDGFEIRYSGPTFNEFTVRCRGRKAAEVLEGLAETCFIGGVDLGLFAGEEDCFLVAVTECHTREMLDAYLNTLTEIGAR